MRILAAMALPGIHELIHLDEVPKPCAACPIQTEQELLRLTAEFANTDTIVRVKKDTLIQDWTAWCRGTVERRRVRRQMVANYFDLTAATRDDEGEHVS